VSEARKLERLLSRAGVRRIFAALDGEGEELRIVGGAVRNALLGEDASDIDLATTAAPDRVASRAEKAGFKVVPTGIDHGTLTLLLDGAHFEVTTLREDVETDGRRAKVRFGRDFAGDARRRDFTINALSLDGRGQIFDYVGGRADLAARRVRFIGDPARRIAEDYLRILRFFRFSACYGAGPLDAEGLSACIALRDGLETLSHERIGAETLKILAAPRAGSIAEIMAHSGLLAFLPCAPWPARLRGLRAEGEPGDGLLGLAALALHNEADVERLGEALRLSNAQKKKLVAAARAAAFWHGAREAPAPSLLREALYRFGADGALAGLALIRAEAGAAPDDLGFARAAAFLRDTPPPRAPFDAADVTARGVKKGPGLGLALKKLQALWIRAGFPNDPQSIAQLIDEACAAGEDSFWTRTGR
jgi:poly(A) polymerase